MAGGKRGPDKRFPERAMTQFEEGTVDRMCRVRRPNEKIAEFIRCAVERELAVRESVPWLAAAEAAQGEG